MPTQEAKRKAVEILRKARALITDKKHWTKGVFRRSLIEEHKPSKTWGTAYCVFGAVHQASGVDYWRECDYAKDLLQAALDRRPRGKAKTVIGYNDSRGTTHAQILALIDKAIALGEENAKTESPLV